MNTAKSLLILAVLMALAIRADAQGSAFTYQGRLSSGTNAVSGLYDFQFVLSNAPSGGSQIAGPLSRPAVGVTNGLFVVTLDFTNVFGGADVWLGISVRSNGTSTYTSLNPPQQITPTPYAIYAGTASAAGLSGTVAPASLPNGLGGSANTASAPGATVTGGETNTANGGDAVVTGGNSNLASGGAATVAGGEFNTASGNLAIVAGGAGNKASGNFSFAAGHDAQATNDGAFVWADSQGVNFYSVSNDSFNVRAQGGARFVTSGAGLSVDGPISTGNQALEFKVNGQRGLRLEYGTDGTALSANVIGGYVSNSVASGVAGATIAGGGFFLNSGPGVSQPNQVLADFGTVGGGEENTAGGIAATVPGGFNNTASGNYSFAAGHDAQATNTGSFVWADSQFALFPSTNNDSFNVRAQGGARFVTGGAGLIVDSKVGIGTSSPGAVLDANITSAAGLGTLIAQLGSPAGSRIQFYDDSPGFGLGPRINFNDSNPGVIQGSTNIALLPTGSVGINTTTPNTDSQLQVSGKVRMGSETGTSQAPNRSILVRRINSTSTATGQVVARSLTGGGAMTLERDGTSGGLVIKITGAAGGAPQISGSGINSSNLTVNVYNLILGGGNNTTNQVFTDAQRIGYCRIMFGDAFNNAEMTTVEMMRAVDNSGNNTATWVGTVTSTVNQ